MAGPWEKYQNQEVDSSGPWTQYQQQPDSNYSTSDIANYLLRENIIRKQGPNVIPDIKELGGNIAEFVQDPIDAITGLGRTAYDIGTGAFSKAYPNISERIMSPETRARGELVAEAAYEALPKSLEDVEKRIIEKPITSLIDLSFLGKFTGSAIKQSNKFKNLGEKISEASDVIDPTRPITYPFEKYVKSKQARNEILNNKEINKVLVSEQSQKAGYKLVPSFTPAPKTRQLVGEKFVGDANVKLAAEIENQAVTNKLANQYLKLPEDTTLNAKVIKDLKSQYGKTYEKVQNLKGKTEFKDVTIPAPGSSGRIGMTQTVKQPNVIVRNGDEILKDWKTTSRDVTAAWEDWHNGSGKFKPGDDRLYDKAIKLEQKFANIESELEQLARINNKPGLVQELKDARTNYAKLFTIEKALDKTTGDISANMLARTANRKLLEGTDAAKIYDFASTYPILSKVPAKQTSTGFGTLDAQIATYNAGRLLSGSGDLSNVAGVTLPFAKRATLSGILNPATQKELVTPSFGILDKQSKDIRFSGILDRGSQFLSDPYARKIPAYAPSILESTESEEWMTR